MMDQDKRRQEQLRRINNVRSFLKRSETKYPNLAGQLPNLLSKMLGGQSFDPVLMEQHAGEVAMGTAILGDWLKENGFNGFRLDLGLLGNGAKDALKLAAKAAGKYPDRGTFFQTSGIPRENWPEMQAAINDLSTTVGQALEAGYTPRQTIATLLIDSTVPVGKDNANTFIPARAMLVRASGGQLPQVNQILNNWKDGK